MTSKPKRLYSATFSGLSVSEIGVEAVGVEAARVLGEHQAADAAACSFGSTPKGPK